MKFLPSPYNHFNGNVEFIDGDTKELYEENLKIQPLDWKYRNKSVKYSLNSQFYRTKEFDQVDWNNSIVIFGCSTVFGIGLDESETLSSQVTKLTGIPTINIGYPGSSCQLSLYNSSILMENNIKPRAVVFGWTSSSRCTLFMNKGKNLNDFYIVNCGSWSDDISGLGKAWYKYESNAKIHFQMTRMVARNLWKSVSYVDYTIFRDVKNHEPKCRCIKQIDFARDMSHPGEKTNMKIAYYIANSLKL